MIPIQIWGSGDLSRAALFNGYAREEAKKLQARMSFQSINENHCIRKPEPGIVVECWVSFSIVVAIIYAEPPKPGRIKVGKKAVTTKECLCLPHFALGKITKVIPEIPVQEEQEEYSDFRLRELEYIDFKLEGQFTYNVLVCSIDKYLLYEGMYSTGWGKYFEGQYVIVTVGDGMDEWIYPYNCSKHCLTKGEKFDVLVISSIHVPDQMVAWKKSLPEFLFND